MNLRGIPTQIPDGKLIPRHGPGLRKIAEGAVKFVYNHGTGKPRAQNPYLRHREELGRRFRHKYSSAPLVGDDNQDNVQPTFIGVFDTVASLRTAVVRTLVWGLTIAVGAAFIAGIMLGWSLLLVIPLGVLIVALGWQISTLLIDKFKYFIG